MTGVAKIVVGLGLSEFCRQGTWQIELVRKFNPLKCRQFSRDSDNTADKGYRILEPLIIRARSYLKTMKSL